MTKHKEQILEEYDKKFDHFNDLYAGRPENRKHKDVGKQICDPLCEKCYDLRDVRKFLSKALDKTQQATIEEIEDILENKVKVYSKFNFCKKCQEQPALKDNTLIMYVEKELDKAIDKLKKG